MQRLKSIFKSVLVILIIIFFLLLKFFIPAQFLSDNDYNIIGCFIEWFGIIYGVLLALVVVEVWQKNAMINTEIDREADALMMLLKTARYIKSKAKAKNVALKIRDYAEKVIMLQGDNSFGNQEITDRLDAIHREAGKIVIDEKTPLPIALEIIHQVNEAIDKRGDWIARTKEHVPQALWVLILFTSVSWVLCFYGLKIDNKYLAHAIASIAMFTVVAIILIIRDIDNPKGGLWRLDFRSFEFVKDEAEKPL